MGGVRKKLGGMDFWGTKDRAALLSDIEWGGGRFFVMPHWLYHLILVGGGGAGQFGRVQFFKDQGKE